KSSPKPFQNSRRKCVQPPRDASSNARPSCATKRGSYARKCCKIWPDMGLARELCVSDPLPRASIDASPYRARPSGARLSPLTRGTNVSPPCKGGEPPGAPKGEPDRAKHNKGRGGRG